MEKWIIYRNNGHDIIGNEDVGYQITNDIKNALIFPNESSARDYKKFYDEESIKSGNGKWMVKQIQ